MDKKLRIMLLVAVVAALAGVGGSFAYAASAEGSPNAAGSDPQELGMMAIGAAIAIAVPGLAAALGLSMATSSIAAAGAERPEIIGRFFIFVVFIEAIAIYALIVAIFIIMMLPAYIT